MKKRRAKLHLSRETLSTLTTGALRLANGGDTVDDSCIEPETLFTQVTACLETNWTGCGCGNATNGC